MAYIKKEELAETVRRNLMPNVDADGTVSVESAERYFLKLIEDASTADVAQQKWIPVTEPPKKKGCYLVAGNYCWEGKPVAREAVWNGNGWLSCYDKHPIKPPVTHWMPLPQPPKEGE